MAKRVYKRWAITGNCGLYTGQYLTRRDAISDHVWHLNKHVSRFAGNGLDSLQRFEWKRCLKKGDRAVKVLIRVVGGAR